MVDPYNLTNFNRTTSELEELILFSVAVAGKTAYIIANSLENFLKSAKGKTPFAKVQYLYEHKLLYPALAKARLGKYNLLGRAYPELVYSGLDLKTCSAQDLEKIHGIGPKTSRLFLLHSRRNQQLAVLDTHILKYLSNLGHVVPKATPTGRKYAQLERIFLHHARQIKRDVAELDLEIWKTYAK